MARGWVIYNSQGIPLVTSKAHDHTAADGSGPLTDDEHDGFSEYDEIAAPSTPAANKVRLYATSGNFLSMKDADGSGVAIQGILDRNLDQVDVVSTVIETSIYSHSIPANTLGVTGGFRVTIGGDTLHNGGDGVIIRVKLGATTLFASNSTGFTNQAGRYQWTLVIWCMNSTASAQKMGAMGLFVANDAEFSMNALSTASAAFLAGYNTSAEDTTGALTLDVTAQWNASDANSSFRKEMAIMELLPAI